MTTVRWESVLNVGRRGPCLFTIQLYSDSSRFDAFRNRRPSYFRHSLARRVCLLYAKSTSWNLLASCSSLDVVDHLSIEQWSINERSRLIDSSRSQIRLWPSRSSATATRQSTRSLFAGVASHQSRQNYPLVCGVSCWLTCCRCWCYNCSCWMSYNRRRAMPCCCRCWGSRRGPVRLELAPPPLLLLTRVTGEILVILKDPKGHMRSHRTGRPRSKRIWWT